MLSFITRSALDVIVSNRMHESTAIAVDLYTLCSAQLKYSQQHALANNCSNMRTHYEMSLFITQVYRVRATYTELEPHFTVNMMVRVLRLAHTCGLGCRIAFRSLAFAKMSANMFAGFMMLVRGAELRSLIFLAKCGPARCIITWMAMSIPDAPRHCCACAQKTSRHQTQQTQQTQQSQQTLHAA